MGFPHKKKNDEKRLFFSSSAEGRWSIWSIKLHTFPAPAGPVKSSSLEKKGMKMRFSLLTKTKVKGEDL